jgi:ubiquinone/menaquinone biosynthesis C-methylase UbiE
VHLIGDDELASSSVVANRDMNRQRGLTGRDGYARVLGIDLLGILGRPDTTRWLDLCCGTGSALLAAAALPRGHELEITGVDLVDFFAAEPPPAVRFVVASIMDWQPEHRFDLITCVHGLHYVGDKLGLLTKVASWLTTNGQFVANFDTSSICLDDGAPAGRHLTTALRTAGFDYDGRANRISRRGHAEVTLPFQYLGADDQAGPNYTGQPAVHSYYEGAIRFAGGAETGERASR